MVKPLTVYLTVAFTFCTLSIATAGLATLQNACVDDTTVGTATGAAYLLQVDNFNALLGCKKVYRYWWFVIAYEIFAIFGLLISTLVGGLRRQHASWMGLFAVGALLWISLTEAFLTAQDVTWYQTTSTLPAKSRVIVAGGVLTALLNTWFVCMLGARTESDNTRTDAEEKVAAI